MPTIKQRVHKLIIGSIQILAVLLLKTLSIFPILSKPILHISTCKNKYFFKKIYSRIDPLNFKSNLTTVSRAIKTKNFNPNF